MAVKAGLASAVVVGAGSIGSRHTRNLHALGVDILAVCDQDVGAARKLAEETAGFAYSSLDEALARHEPIIGLICTPPVFHVQQARQLIEAGAHVFIEKPLSHSSAEIPALIDVVRASGRLVQIGYNLRFHPGLVRVKQVIDSGVLGRILWAHIEVGQYLPDWRPATDYRKTYTARSEMGGGILLDASHEIDYACWMLGEPVELACMMDRTGVLEMDAEDSATLLVRFADGARADIHLDCLQRTYSRGCKLVGCDGTLIWDYTANELRIWHVDDPHWRSETYEFDPNDMYMAEMEHFIRCVRADAPTEVSLEDGWRAIRVVESARRSVNSLRMVK